MIRVDQIPYEVKRAMRVAWSRRNNDDAPEKHMADLAVAMINAWPGVRTVTEYFTSAGDHWEPAIILPLPDKENDNG